MFRAIWTRTEVRLLVTTGPFSGPRFFCVIAIGSLQPQHDPVTGKVSYVFSCFNQDQPIDRVDFAGLASRLALNSVQEKLTAQWIGRCLRRRVPSAT